MLVCQKKSLNMLFFNKVFMNMGMDLAKFNGQMKEGVFTREGGTYV